MKTELDLAALDIGARSALNCVRGSVRSPDDYQRRPQKRHAAPPIVLPGTGSAASRRTMVHERARRASAGAWGLAA